MRNGERKGCLSFPSLLLRWSEEDQGHKAVQLEEDPSNSVSPGRRMGTGGEEQESMDNVDRQAQQN